MSTPRVEEVCDDVGGARDASSRDQSPFEIKKPPVARQLLYQVEARHARGCDDIRNTGAPVNQRPGRLRTAVRQRRRQRGLS